jgi:hypothetical protein
MRMMKENISTNKKPANCYECIYLTDGINCSKILIWFICKGEKGEKYT